MYLKDIIRGESIMKIPRGALIWYNINDIKISDTVRKERIHDLRKKTDVLVIDDEKFEPKEFLEGNNYRLTSKTDIDNVKDVSEYPIILCDIRGIGKKMSSSFEGAFLIKEIKENYPEKIVIAYTASQYDPSYNVYLQRADNILSKSLSTEEWLDVLDKYIFQAADPVYQWKILRDRLIILDIPLLDIAKLEDAFVKSFLKEEFTSFEKLGKSMDSEVTKIISDFVSNIVIKLIKGK